MRLAGKVALVTGAGQGIGKAAAIRFAQEGAAVGVTDWNAETGQATTDLINKEIGRAVFVHGDVSKPADCERMVEDTVRAFGRIDVLLNNAGIAYNKPCIEWTVEEWETVIGIHLRGPWLLCKHAIPHMKRQGGGSIVNVSSIGGVVAVAGTGAYAAAKAGILGLTKLLAFEHAKDNIRVNAYCPGIHKTPILEGWIASAPDPAAEEKRMSATQPLGRLGTAEEVANVALFLASDESSFCTGGLYMVDGGYSLP